MSNFVKPIASLLMAISTSSALAQSSAWDGLDRTTFDIPSSTLRIPCAALEDGTGQALSGFAPAYALNFQVVNDGLRLVEPIQAFTEVPETCLDTLTVDGNIATYSTESAEVDSTDVGNSNRFYTIELSANISGEGPIDFSVLSAEDRLYIRPAYEGESFAIRAGVAPYTSDFIYTSDIVNEARGRMIDGLTVYQHGILSIQCAYSDPLGLLEEVESTDGNSQYRIKSSLTSADNDKIFSIDCTVFDRDINRLELTVPLVEWLITLP